MRDGQHRADGVRAFFADGRHADGDLLVGADGSNSRVRHQRLPELTRQDPGIVTIAGRVPLTGAVAAALPAEFTDGAINNVVPARSGWMFLSTWSGEDDTRSVVWAWAEAGRPGDLRRALIAPGAGIGAYETAMREYANRALQLSTRNARGAALTGPANRAVFRALLRAGSRIPALQHRMFGPTVR